MSASEQATDRVQAALLGEPKRRSLLRKALAAAAVACVSVGTVRAADDAGVYDFIRSQVRQSRSEAQPSAPTRQMRAPAQRTAPAVARWVREPVLRRESARVHKPASEPRVRYVSLPRSEEKPVPRKAKPATVEVPKAAPRPMPGLGPDPIAAVLRDPTLRPGDIVMFPDGARVFKGDRAPPHAVASFEDVRRSRLISAASRKAALALSKPVAAPGREAGRPAPQALAADAEPLVRSAAVRVIYPMAVR